MPDAKLRVHVEYGELKADFEGNADEVSAAFIDFLNKVCPTFELASRLAFKPDLVELTRTLEGVIEYSPDGLILAPKELTSEEAIILSLLGTYVGNKLGILDEDSISINEIANASGKASKTILNQLKAMIDEGLTERTGRGEYKIKSQGIKRSKRILQELKTRGKQ